MPRQVVAGQGKSLHFDFARVSKEQEAALQKWTTYPKKSFSQLFRPIQPLQKAFVKSHFHNIAFNDQYANVLQDKGNILPACKTAREKVHGLFYASLHYFPREGDVQGYASVLQGHSLLMT